MVRNIVANLKAYTQDDPSFQLQHLTYRAERFERAILKLRSKALPPSALRPLKGNASSISLGPFSALPLEVLWSIFSEFSIPIIQSFKATNSLARSMVCAAPQYMSIMRFAPQIVTMLYHTHLELAFPIGRIHETLTQAKCEGCARFAAYVFIPGLQRCCQRCARYDDNFQPILLGDAVSDYGITYERVMGLPWMLTCLSKDRGHQRSGKPLANRPKRAIVSKAEAQVRESPSHVIRFFVTFPSIIEDFLLPVQRSL